MRSNATTALLRRAASAAAPAAAVGCAASSSATTSFGRKGSAEFSSVAGKSAVTGISSSLLLRTAAARLRVGRGRWQSHAPAQRAHAPAQVRTLSNAAKASPPPPPPPPAAAPKPANDGGGGFPFLAWYESHLQSRPVPTKMITGGFLWGIGDVVAQVVPALTHPPEEKGAITTAAIDFDYPRLGRAAIFGFALHAPIAHVHYNFLESLTVRAGVTGLGIPVFKAFMEQFVYWSWFSNSLYHSAMGLMQGWSVQQCYNRVADVLWDTQKAQWAFWIPVQLVNFNYVPVRHQLNVVLLTSVVWTALLSAWYPPQAQAEEGQGSKKDKQE